MKQVCFFIIGFLITTISSVAQYSVADVNRFANWNDPVYKRNVPLWYQQQVIGSKQPTDLSALQNIRDQQDPDWIESGLSTFWVPNEDAKKQLINAIVQEINRLKEAQKAKVVAYRKIPASVSENYRGQYLAAFNENVKLSRLYKLEQLIRIGKGKTTTISPDNNNLESEFRAEIGKINSEIGKINTLARNRELELSLVAAQKLCDKIRLLQGRQYFSSTLKKIRKENPGFTFTITPLADQVTREYWIKMRNRANLSYRKAMEAYSGCVYNEGIQQAGYVEIPFGFAKATLDLMSNWKDLFGKKLFGTFSSLMQNSKKAEDYVRPLMVVSEDIIKAGGDAYDWKSYVGVVGGFISAFDGYVKTYNIAVENYAQGDLLVMNRQSAKQLIQSNKLLLQEFDRYRAFIESQSSSIDCLDDKIMRLKMDKNSIKGDKVTIWGTGLYDWDGEEYLNQIKEAGEDLKNDFIYCEDFIKILQIAVNQAMTSYTMIEDKVKSSGADKSQIDAQLSYNHDNGEYFETESSRLSEYYSQFCENNTYPSEVIVVSPTVVPGVEVQDGNPDDPPVWEYENEETYTPPDNPPHNDPFDKTNTPGTTTRKNNHNSGAGWSSQKTTVNETSLTKDISLAVNNGKTPVGIYVGNTGEVEIYYIDDNPFGMTAWNLEWYNDAASLQSGITNNMESGYLPMGISFTDEGKLYVLYIMSQLSSTGWQLVESEPDLTSVSNNVQPWINEQYIPVGITVFSNMYYSLLVQMPDSEHVNWTIEGYEDKLSLIQQGINSNINTGLIPFGYLKEQEIVNVLYIGF